MDHELETKLNDIMVEQLAFTEALRDKYDGRLDALTDEVLKMKTPGFVGSPNRKLGGSIEMKAFGTFLRRGANALRPDELKVLRVSDDVQAGYLCPTEVANEIIKGVTEYSPLRTIAKLRQCRREAIEIPKKTGSGAATWVSETGTRAEVTGLTFGQERIERGVDIVTVKELLGHSTIILTQHYTHSRSEQRRRAVEQLDSQPAAFLSHFRHTEDGKPPVSRYYSMN